tara:strand:- start:1199 stop:1486 length:288 start_codon:yes stop_codon:yes gene_type:complete
MTMMRSEEEMEELIAKNQLLGLCISALLVMVLVWATLPSEDNQLINRVCAQQCKEIISGNRGELNIFSGPVYFEEMGKCHRGCAEEANKHNENID